MKTGGSDGTFEIKDIEPGLLRQRRNLLGISLAIIMFHLAGGKIGNIPTPFGAISISRPDVVMGAVWIFLIYSVWRYWLYSEPTRGKFQREFLNEIYLGMAYRNLVKSVIADSESKGGPGSTNEIPALEARIFKRTLNFNKSMVVVHPKTKSPNVRRQVISDYEGEPSLNVSYWKILPIELVASAKAILVGRSFSDHYLPYLMAMAAIVIGVLRQFTGIP